jgi:rRNA maturation RNase YbeY
MISYSYQTDFPELDEVLYTRWLDTVAATESKIIGELGYVFCTDDFLHQMNVKYLDHDSFTDIITFDYSDEGVLNGEVYISIDRVRDNASRFRESEIDELHRVMVHGLLHLAGYPDKTEEERTIMREKETEKIMMFHVKHQSDV